MTERSQVIVGVNPKLVLAVLGFGGVVARANTTKFSNMQGNVGDGMIEI